MDGMPKDVVYSGDWILRPLVEGTVEIAMYQGTAKKVKIPDQIDGKLVTRIGDKAFYECEIEEVEMPDSITEIGASAFSKCHSLYEIKFSKNLISIGNYAFAETWMAQGEFELPESVKTIGNFAFTLCRGRFNSFRFGTKLEKVGLSLFSGTYLDKIFLPNRPIDMRGVLYSRDADITPLEVDLGEQNDYFTYEKGILFNQDKTVLFYATYVYSETENFFNYTEYIIPDGVKEIGPHAFAERYTLRTLSFPTSIKSVGKDILFWFERIQDRNNNNDYSFDAFIKNLVLRDENINGIKTDVVVKIPVEGNTELLDETRQYFKMNRDKTFFDFDAYDESFSKRKSRDDKIAMATCRIKTPLRLSEEYKTQYIQYLKKNAKVTVLKGLLDKELDKYDDDGLYMPMQIMITDDQYEKRKVKHTKEIESNVELLCSIEAIGKSIINDLIEAAKANNKDSIAQILIDYKVNSLKITGDVKTNLNSVAELKKKWTVKDNLDGTLTINGYKGTETILEIPSQIGSKIVTDIGMDAFNSINTIYNTIKKNSNNNIVEIIIPNSVTEIGRYAFKGCSALQSITISENMTKIETGVFSGCRSLQRITIPSNVTKISSDAFEQCLSLQNIELHKGVTSIESSAFKYCRSLSSINIPESVTKICYDSFYGCTCLESVVIPESVTEICMHTFYGCTCLESIVIPASVQFIECGAFEGCINLNNVSLQRHDVNVYSRAFQNTKWISRTDPESGISKINNILIYKNNVIIDCLEENENVVIPDGVQSLGGIFSGSKILQNISIPSSVHMISRKAFAYCENLNSVTLSCGISEIGMEAFSGCSSLKSITIPDSVTSIGESAFDCCTNLTSITIPDSVTSIGESAFSGCSSLKSITIPSSVTKIDNRAFACCENLNSVTLSRGISEIGVEAFIRCRSLSSINISEDVTVIDKSAFEDCIKLKSITIPSSVTKIVYRAFARCENLNSVTLSRGISEIGMEAFIMCSGLSSINIPEGVTKIFYMAFAGCSSLQTMIIPSSVTEIGESAFKDCIKLKSITIPSSVTEIGKRAFSCCENLNSVTLSRGISEIGEAAFYDCSSLSSINIPDGVTVIGYKAFAGCSSLQTMIIPSSVTEIGKSAFSDCIKLKSITIPNSVTEIGIYAFSDIHENAIVHCSKASFAYNYCIRNGIKAIE